MRTLDSETEKNLAQLAEREHCPVNELIKRLLNQYVSPKIASQVPFAERNIEMLDNNAMLRISEQRYRRLFETAQDGILLLNAETAQIEDINPFLLNLLGYSHEEFLAKTLWEISAFKDSTLNKEMFLELQTQGYIRYDNIPLVGKDGHSISVEFISNIYICDNIPIVQCNIRDNTKRNLAEIALQATTRALFMLNKSNVALLNSSSETVLLSEYCRIAVETGGYQMAWIGLADNGADKAVRAISYYGHEDGYLSLADITWADTERGQGPTGRAIRSGEIQFVDDIASNPIMKFWRDEALKRGYKSSISLPFQLPNGIMACLTLYSSRCNVWNDSERKLLAEIVSDLNFGIAALRTAISKMEYQKSLETSLEQTIQVVVDAGEERDSYTAGHQRRVAHLCTKIAQELGLAASLTHGLHLAASIHDLGKIGIPIDILVKPRRLTAPEFNLIKEHPTIGFNIIKNVNFLWPIAQIILQHHEFIDGTGYPSGLKGDEILLESKILTVADIVEAMASHRPYRPALGIDAALSEITRRRGVSLDTQVVDACLRLFTEQGYEFQD
ncbi:MAG: HD domain-containing protein [Methylococcales bacterium]|nr:HD domain-containing protein [Methylococcales bacterium]